MKKIISMLVAVLMFSMLLVGCSDEKGKYVLTQIKVLGVTVEAGSDAWEKYYGDKKAEDCAYLELKDDGKFDIVLDLGNSDTQRSGDYEIDGNEITLTVDGSPEKATLEDGKIQLDVDSASVIFEKQ